jgi:oligosaccharide reducing-end xylanase
MGQHMIEFGAVSLLALTTGVLGAQPAPPNGPAGQGSGTSPAPELRNLFVEAGYTADQVDTKIDAAFGQLFHGDPDEQAVYYPAGTNANGALAALKDVANDDVRSEGMSYGMMVAVQLNKKAEFDALWNWARTTMYHDAPGHPARGYFSWSMRTDGTPRDEMPAPDGEEYFAMALYFAANRWGNGTGIYDYRAAADRLLTDMVHREVITGPTSRGTHAAGAMFDTETAMVRFSPLSDFTDPSYHVPAFYELWAKWGPQADRPFWSRAAAVSRDFFQKVTNPVTGLSPDYANFDGTLRSGMGSNFQYDAWRTAMNWAVDWAWWAKDVRERQLSDRLQAFFESKGMSDYADRFTVDGNPLGEDHSEGLVAMNAVAGLAATDQRSRKFVDALWNTPVPSGHYRYYNGMLYLLGMLHCGGQFRIWSPQEQQAPPASATNRR